jgi:hypothetical protein
LDKDNKLSLILMRDDGRVRQYQFRTVWFRLFLYAQALLLVGALLGASGGFFHWSRHMEAVNTHADLQKQISDLRVHMERLRHAQEILTGGEHEHASHFSTLYTARSAGSRGQPIDLYNIFKHKDLQLVSLSNVQLQSHDEKLRLRFELHNLEDKAVSVMTSVYFVGRDASVVLAQGEKNEWSFTIQRYHKLNSLLDLPSGLALEDVFALLLVISNTEHEDMFIQTYILSDIMAMM